MIALAEKVCTKCKVEQTIDCFRADPRYADGYCGHCRSCRSATAIASQKRNREKIAERTKARRAANPEKHREQKRRHYAANKDYYAAKNKAWREDNRDHRNAYQRAYFANRIANDSEFAERIKALSRQTSHTRDARKRGQFVEHVDPRVVWERDGGICGLCREPVLTAVEFHVDHVIPLSKGGDHSYANTQVAHAVCNLRKGGGSHN